MTMQMVQEQNELAGDAGDFDLLDLYPEACPPFLVRAWLDCLMWSVGAADPNFLEMFTSETGIHAPMPAKTPIEAMIDQATGHTPSVQMHAFLKSYIPWFNQNVWGDGSEPEGEKGAA